MRLLAVLAVLLAISCGIASGEEEYSFDLSEIEKKPWHIGGYVEFRPVLHGLDTNAAILGRC
jgi:hypothetical protein